MKAIVVREFGPPDVLRLEEADDPAPGRGEVRVRVHAAGVNPADTYIRAGTYARKPSLPYTPGRDYAGIIDAAGEGVTRFEIGDRVYGHGVSDGCGAYAELTVADQWEVEPLPDAATFAQGASIGIPYGTAWRALFMRAAAKPAESVLVHGASGAVGIASVQIARAAGMRVIGTAGSEAGLRLVEEQGAHTTLDHRTSDYLNVLMDETGGRGVDVIIEMLANVNLDRDLDVLARGGRVVVIGNRGRIEIDPRKIMSRDASVIGMLMFNTGPADLREIHAGIVAGLEAGTLRPVVGREFRLAEAARAHSAVMEPGAYGKIVLIP